MTLLAVIRVRDTKRRIARIMWAARAEVIAEQLREMRGAL